MYKSILCARSRRMKPRLFSSVVLCAFLATLWAAQPASTQTTIMRPAQVYSYGMFGVFAFSPDGTRIALGHNHAISMLDAGTLKRLDTFFTTHYGPDGETYSGDVCSLAFSPDGSRIIIADSLIATVFDATTGAIVLDLGQGALGAQSVAYSHNGDYLLTGDINGGITLWNASAGAAIRSFAGHTDTVDALAFSHDDSQALSGSHDNTAILWDVGTGSIVRELSDHTGTVTAVAFMPDGITPVTASEDGTVRRWDAAGALVMNAPDAGRVESMAVSGQFIAGYSMYGPVFLWDSTTGQALDSLLASLFFDTNGNAQSTRQVAFSPDGARLLTGSAAGKCVRLWDLAVRKQTVQCVGHTNSVTSVAYSVDGTRVLTGSEDNTAKLWDAGTGTVVRTFSGHADSVTSVALSRDGKKVLTGSHDDTAKVWDAGNGTVLLTFTGHTDWVNSAAFSPDGTKALTGSRDGTAKLWDAATGKELQTFAGGDALYVSSVAFSPDGKKVLLGTYLTARLCDASTGTVLVYYGDPDRAYEVASVAFSPDGKKVLTSSSYEQTATLWDEATGTLLQTYTGHTDEVTSVTFSSDGLKVLTGSNDQTARLWDTQSGENIGTLIGHTDTVTSVAFSPDAKKILTGSDDNTARITPVPAGVPIASLLLGLKSDWAYLDIVSAFSPDGTRILTNSDDYTAKLWDVKSGAVLQTFAGHTNDVRAVAFSPDGKKVLTGSNDETVKLWDVTTGAVLQTFTVLTGGPIFPFDVTFVAFSPDGAKVLGGSQNGTAFLWDANDGSVLQKFWELNVIFHMRAGAFSPDGTKVIIALDNYMASLWDVATGRQLVSFSNLGNALVNGVAYFQDGSQVLTGSADGTAKLWDPANGAELHTYGRPSWAFGVMPPAVTGAMSAVAFSPDRTKILTGGLDLTARLWDLATTRELCRFTGFDVQSVSFSPDGTQILTSGGGADGGMVVLWDVPPVAKPSGQPITLATSDNTQMALDNAFEDYTLALSDGQAKNLVVRIAANMLPEKDQGRGAWTLVGSRGELPSLTSHDWAGNPAGLDKDGNSVFEMLVPSPQADTYNFSAYYANSDYVETAYFTIECLAKDQYVSGLSVNTGSNSGSTTVQVFGLGFVNGVSVELLNSDGHAVRTFAPTSLDTTSLVAAMDLSGLPAGSYNVAVVWPSATLTSPQTFTVTAGSIGPKLEASIEPPPMARYGRPYTLWLDYANTGDADMPAPLFIVSLQGVPYQMRQNPESDWQAAPALVLGVNPQGVAGVLSAGTHNRIPIYFMGFQGDSDDGAFQLEQLKADDTPMDWKSVGLGMNTGALTEEAWNVIWGRFTAQIGSTGASVLARLDADATVLAQQGRLTYDVRELFAYELGDVDACAGGSQVLTTAIDAQCPAAGLPLTFNRTCRVSFDQRFRLGPLGRGWSHSYEYALIYSKGIYVMTCPGGLARMFFYSQEVHDYQGAFGDHGKFMLVPGNIPEVTEPDGTLRVFDAETGRLASITDPNGNIVTLTYDSGGLLTQIAHSNGGTFTLSYNAAGRLDKLTDHAGQVTTYSYDAGGEYLVSATGPGGVTTAYSYDSNTGPTQHTLQTVTYPDGSKRYLGYDQQGRLSGKWMDGNAQKIAITYDRLGSKTVTDATGAASRFFYGPTGELRRYQDPLDNMKQFEYDGSFDVTRFSLPDGSVDTMTYDSIGDLINWIDPLQGVVNAGYASGIDRLTRVKDANGNVTNFVYDASDNLTKITYPDNTSEQFQYATGGSQTASANRRQQVVAYTRNAMGQVTRKDYPDGSSVAYTYDAAGRLTSTADSTGVINLSYDARGFPIAIQYPSGHGFTFQYNNAGQRTQRAGDDGYTLNYAYDANARLAQVTDGTGAEIVLYEYDDAGRISRETKGNGTYASYGFDAAGHVASVVNCAPGGAVQSRFDYTYDPNGNPASMTTLDGVTTYGYDAAGQLTGVVFPNGREIAYEYDAAGNRKRVTDNGAATQYIANALNQYTQIGSAAYGYDADGNMASRTDATGITTYQYDAENRLTKAVSPTDGTWNYTYDGLGQRDTVTHDGKTTRLVHDPAGFMDAVAEYDASGTLTARYVYGAGLVATRSSDGKNYYYAYDGFGQTRQLSGSDGAVANAYDYDPFGGLLANQESTPNPYRYAGRRGVVQETNGLLFMKTRYYDAASGRFVSPDSLGYRGGINLYAYCYNSPVLYVDPVGGGDSWWDSAAKPGSLFTDQGAKAPTPDQLENLANTGQMPENQNYQNLPDALKPIGAIAERAENGDSKSVDLLGKALTAVADMVVAESSLTEGIGEGMDLWGEGFKTLAGQLSEKREPFVESEDPNEKESPRGAGSESQRIVPPDARLPYTVYFENASTASAPAQEVVVTDQLNAGLDASTFNVTGIAWGAHQVAIPAGATSFHGRETVMDYRADAGKFWYVDVDVAVDSGSGSVRGTFKTIDPDTGKPPEDPLAGFLPPNDATHRGEGYLMFSAKPKVSLPGGTRITNKASVVFDTAPAIATNEVFNTIDTPGSDHSPVLVNPGNQSSAPGQSVSLQLTATDSDGDPLLFDATGLPSGLAVNPVSGLISGTLDNSAHDSYSVAVSVSDGRGGSDSKSFTWTIGTVSQTGALTVTIQPTAAVTAGAQWSIDGGTTWNNSGATLNNLSAGKMTVSFKDVSGWTKPTNQTATITANATATATGTYTQEAQAGALTVTILPAAAVTAGAQWSIDGGTTWNNSGTTLNNLSAGGVIVSFKDISGWTKPTDQNVTITAGTTATATSTYTKSSNSGGCFGGTLDRMNPPPFVARQCIGDMLVLALTVGLLLAIRRRLPSREVKEIIQDPSSGEWNTCPSASARL